MGPGRRRRSGAAVLATVAVVGTVLVLLSGPAAACSCIQSTEEEWFAQADAVFVGTAIAARDVDTSTTGTVVPQGPVAWTFTVEEVRKGQVGSARQELRTARSSAACGSTFDLGQRYLLFAHRSPDGTLATGLCSGNRVADAPVPTTVGATTVPGRPAASPGRLRLTG